MNRTKNAFPRRAAALAPLLLHLLPVAILAIDPPASDYGTAREAMAAFEKADPVTKLDCFHYMAAKALKTGGSGPRSGIRRGSSSSTRPASRRK